MQKILTVYFFAVALAIAAKAGAAVNNVSYENSCRMKAKEVAADTYRNCVTENKTAQLDELKNNYQQRLKALKEDYEKEIQLLGGKTTATKQNKKNEKATLVSSAKKNNSEKRVLDKGGSTTEDMNIELKPINEAKGFEEDQSSMDLPEPIPVEMNN